MKKSLSECIFYLNGFQNTVPITLEVIDIGYNSLLKITLNISFSEFYPIICRLLYFYQEQTFNCVINVVTYRTVINQFYTMITNNIYIFYLFIKHSNNYRNFNYIPFFYL